MRHLLAITVLALVASASASAQITFSITGTDGSQFPRMKVFFDAKDSKGLHIGSFAPSDFTVVEDGITRPVLSVSCPPPRTAPVSITLTVDNSSSMNFQSRLANARNAAIELVRSLQFPPAQMGITRFDDTSRIYQDYTSDSTALISAVSSMVANGPGTDMLGAFLDPVTGAIDFTRTRAGAKYIIFITDGASKYSVAQANQIIAAANSAGIKIYSLLVTTGTTDPNFRNITTRTGGMWFEDVDSEAKARAALSQIVQYVYFYDPCEVVYQTDGCETSRLVTVTLRKNSATVTQTAPITVPANTIITLDASTSLADFGRLAAGVSGTADIVLTARNGSLNVQSLGAMPSQFTIISYGGTAPPFALAQGESRTIRVRYTATDTSRVSGRLLTQSDAPCVHEVVLAGGSINPEPLVLTQPNGGEVLFSGSNFPMKWRGVPSAQAVALDYSTDAGTSWIQVASNAYGLTTPWPVPNTPSTTCLALACTVDKRTASRDALWLPTQPSDVYCIAFAPSGGMLAASLQDGRIKLYGTETGQLANILVGHTGKAHSLSFSPDIRYLASGGDDGKVKIWSPITSTFIRDLTGHTGQVHSVAFSADGRYLVSADQTAVILWRTSDWSQAWRVTGSTSPDGALAFDPRSRWIASATGNNVAVLDITNGAVKSTLTGHSGAVRSLTVSADAQTLASGSEDRSIRIWNTLTWGLVKALAGHTNGVTSVALSQSGMHLLSASRDKSVKVWDVRSGSQKQSFTGHTNEVLSAGFDWRTGLVASGGIDHTIRLWGYAMPLSDRSDSLWTIITPSTTLDVGTPEFASVLCPGEYSDGIVHVKNIGNQPITITGASFSGPSASAFGFVPGFSIPPTRQLKPEDTLDIPLRFFPIPSGDHSATFTITTDAASLPSMDIALSGRKDSANITVLTDTLDAGELYTCTVPVTLPVVLSNTGTVDVRIDSVSSGAPGLVSFDPPLPHTLLAGEIDTLHVSVHPTAFGTFSTTIGLQTDPCPASRTLHVHGALVPSTPVAVPSSVAFPYAAVGDTSTATVVIHNPTGSPMKLESGTIDNPAFEILGTVSFPQTIAPHDSVVITMRFIPRSEGTVSSGSLFRVSTPCDDSVRVTLDGSSSRKPEIAYSAGTFLTVLCPNDVLPEIIITITNTGGEQLNVSGLDRGGLHPNDFIVLTSPPLQIAPNGSAPVTVRFNPQAVGARSATLTVRSNATQKPVLVIPLDAVKDSAGMLLAPLSIATGELHPCDLPALRTGALRNTGTVPVTISADIAQLPAGIALSQPLFPLTLQAGDTSSVTFTIDPSYRGSFDALVRFTGAPCALAQSIRLQGSVRASTPILSAQNMLFGQLGDGMQRDDSITVTNPTSVPMRITGLSVNGAAAFLTRIAPPTLPATIPAGGAVTLRFRYAPKGTDTLAALLSVIVDTPCADTVTATLTGTSLAAFADVMVPALQAEIGTRVRIPITMTNSANLALTGTKNFRAVLSFDRSILWPERVIMSAGTGSFTTAPSGRVLSVTVSGDQPASPSNGVLAELECLVMLGVTDTTTLHFDSFTWLTGPATATWKSGAFTALGVCEAGGKRFMAFPAGMTKLTASPNPFNPMTDVLFSVPSTASVSLDVYDMLGRPVRTLASGMYPQGTHRVAFDGSRFPSGLYIATLRIDGRIEGLLKLMLAK